MNSVCYPFIGTIGVKYLIKVKGIIMECYLLF